MALWCFSWWITHNFVQSLILSRYVPQHQSWRQYLLKTRKRFPRFFGFLPPCGLLLSIFGSSISSERNNFVRWILSYLLWMLATRCRQHCALALCAFFSDETISLLTFNPFSLFISALLSGYLASYISFLHISSDSTRRYTNFGSSIRGEWYGRHRVARMPTPLYQFSSSFSFTFRILRLVYFFSAL